MAPADHQPTVFTSNEQILLWQGMQKLINEAQDHRSALLKGFSGTEPDANAQSINEYYGKRIKMCQDIQGKLPQLSHFKKTDSGK